MYDNGNGASYFLKAVYCFIVNLERILLIVAIFVK